MRFYKLNLLVLITFVYTNICAIVFAAPALFASKELQLKDNTPSEADFNRPFEDPLPALVVGANANQLMQLVNCRDYLSVRNQIVGSDNDNDYRVLVLQTVPCTALALLKSASIAPQTALPENFLLNTETATYPASLWPAVSDDERQHLTLPGATLRTASKKPILRKLDDKTLELEASGFGLHLTLLARGDFDHDGWEDMALRWEGYALHGSYTDARLVVLTRTDPNGSFRELPLAQLLPTP